MSIPVIKNFAKNTFEIPLILLAVLLAFVLLFNFLNYVFPHGSSLQFIVDDGQLLGRDDVLLRDNTSLLVDYEGKQESLQSSANITARITSIKRKVKSKAANKIAWSNARPGLALYSRDAVQTFENSSAKIQFDRENYIDLGENSLVIIKKLEDDPILREKVTRLMVFSGELSGKISSSVHNRMRMEIKAPGTKARLASANEKQPALIRFKVNKDKTSTLTVLQGEAVITSNNRKSVVKQDEAITLSGGDDAPEFLTPPEQIRPITPRKDALFRYKDVSPAVKFSWRKLDDIDNYELVVARDRDFNEIVSQTTLDVSYVENSGLSQGTYYWRVRGKRGDIDGPFSQARTFSIVEDNEPPRLVVNFPPDSYGKTSFTVTGTSEPGTVMFINNEPVRIKGNGEFSHLINLQRGNNTIVIESIDKAGNVTYKSKIVNVVGGSQ